MNVFAAYSLLHQLFVPGIIVLLWGIVSFGWPVVSVLLLPAFFPFYFGPVKFMVLGIPFTLIEWMIYVSFGMYMLRSFITWLKVKEQFSTKVRQTFQLVVGHFVPESDWRYSFSIPITLIFIGLLLPLFTVQTGDDRMHLIGIVKEWFVAPLLYFYLMQKVLPGLKSIRRCFEWYTISAVFLSLWGIMQFLLSWFITPDGRVSGPFQSANYLALYIMPAVVFVLLRLWHIFFIPREYDGLIGLFRKIFHVEESLSPVALARYGSFAVVLLFALYLTRSFGAFLGLFGSMFGYGVYHVFFSYWKLPLKKALSWIGIGFLTLSIVASVFFITGDVGKFKQMFNVSGQSSSSVRLQVWRVASDFIGDNFFLGIGAGQFESQYAARATKILGKEPYEKTMLHPHNIFLMFWLSAGLIGLAGFLWLLVLLFWSVAQIKTHDGAKRMGIICATMLAAILLHGLVDTPIWKNDLALQFWMIAGAVATLRKIV